MERYPHQISGGQQQRVVIAMALLNNPALLIMDEPTTALDVTVEAAVLDLIADLRRDFDTAILFISHNLGVIARVSDRVGVMYAGELVELADRAARSSPTRATPTRRGCCAAVPQLGRDKAEQRAAPHPRPRAARRISLPPGCVFEPRCDYARDACRERAPGAAPDSDAHHQTPLPASPKRSTPHGWQPPRERVVPLAVPSRSAHGCRAHPATCSDLKTYYRHADASPLSMVRRWAKKSTSRPWTA